MLTVKDGTRFSKGFEYIKPMVGHMRYWVWTGGIVPSGEGAYAVDRPAPSINWLAGKRIFCAGVPNLMLRAVGKRVPTRGNANYDGGVAAYWDSTTIDPETGTKGYFHGYAKPFDLQTAKRWAQDTGSGVLIGRPFVNDTLAGQGHVAILLPSGYVLQSFEFGSDGLPGLNWDYTIEDSNAGGYYKYMVPPGGWINYAGDEF